MTGPDYTITSTALAKHRRKAKQGLKTLSRAERVAYANAVEAAVKAAQATQLRRHGETMPEPNCASGTAHNCGKAIHAAIRQQQRNACLSWPSKIRKARTAHEWQTMYDQAMKEKRNHA